LATRTEGARPAEGVEPSGAEEAPVLAAPRRGRFWLWVVAVVVVAGAVGSFVGASLGLRQSGPLAGQTAADGRPTIVVATAAAVASATPSPSVVAPTSVARSNATPAVAGASEYVVKPGDTLRTIAQEQYGDAQLWPRIYQANRDVIGADPDALIAGTRLILPPGG
jgi:hypothetical protein